MRYLRTIDEDLKKEDSKRLDRAKEADLVTLPDNIQGTNCGNCFFFDPEKKEGFCNHVKVLQHVTSRMCCSFWDAPGTKREWETK